MDIIIFSLTTHFHSQSRYHNKKTDKHSEIQNCLETLRTVTSTFGR